IVRRRLVGDGFVEHLSVLNHGTETEAVTLQLEFGSDFADLFEVKDALKKKGEFYQGVRDRQLVLGYKRDRFVRGTLISSTTQPTERTENLAIFRINLQPKSVWRTEFHVTPVSDEIVHPPKFTTGAGAAMRKDLKDWFQRTPNVTCHPEAMRIYARS